MIIVTAMIETLSRININSSIVVVMMMFMAIVDAVCLCAWPELYEVLRVLLRLLLVVQEDFRFAL